MTDRQQDEDRLVRYLLDEATEEERSAVEQGFLRDDQGYQELEALEDELRYDYLRGELSPERRRRFEERFLASAEGRLELERARALLEALDVVPPASGPRPVIASWWLAAAAAMVVAVAGAWAWREAGLAQARAEQARAEAQREWALRVGAEKERGAELARELRSERERRAALEQELLRREEAPLPAPAVVALAIGPGLPRGAEASTAALPPGTDRLRLTLRLPEDREERVFLASVRGVETGELWFRGGLERRGTAGRVVTLDVPARLLAAGAYEVALLVEALGGEREEVADYHFEVTRR